jgi:hypothetical protein
VHRIGDSGVEGQRGQDRLKALVVLAGSGISTRSTAAVADAPPFTAYATENVPPAASVSQRRAAAS